jgi:hypothetical protein
MVASRQAGILHPTLGSIIGLNGPINMISTRSPLGGVAMRGICIVPLPLRKIVLSMSATLSFLLSGLLA